jgi:hypothetical protein
MAVVGLETATRPTLSTVSIFGSVARGGGFLYI